MGARVALDSQGNVYLVNPAMYRIEKYESRGQLVSTFGTMGNDEGQLNKPSDIAIDREDNIYVSDFGNPFVQKFDRNGKFILRWGSKGPRDGQFYEVFSVAIDPSGNLLVIDLSGRLQKFDSQGKFLARIPLEIFDNTGPTPWDITVDARGDIYLVNRVPTVILKYNANGKFLAKFGGRGTGAGNFKAPQDVLVDGEGFIYVSDLENQTIQKLRQPGYGR